MVEVSKLNCSFSTLGVGNQFIQQAERLGLFNLGDVMKVNLSRLKQHKEFSFTWYADMLDLLKEQGLLRQFQENQL
ncbi:hypothetical protein DIU36_06510 [Mucilaginibacter rubeus]|nr:hypothetical protein DIU36_06510 [Mucilaginibacter rubeus]